MSITPMIILCAACLSLVNNQAKAQSCSVEQATTVARAAALDEVLMDSPNATPVITGTHLESADPRPDRDTFDIVVDPRDGSDKRTIAVDVSTEDCRVIDVTVRAG